MEKLSRMEKYKELRMEIDSDAAAAGKPSINSVELQKQLRSLNEPQDDEGSSRHSRQTERFSKEIDLQLKEETDEGTDQFHNEYLDDFINEVKEYNLEKGNRMSGNTQIDILLQLNKGKDRIQSMRNAVPYWANGSIKTPDGQTGCTIDLQTETNGKYSYLDNDYNVGRGIATMRPSAYYQYEIWTDKEKNDMRGPYYGINSDNPDDLSQKSWREMEDLYYNNLALKDKGSEYYGKHLVRPGGMIVADSTRCWFRWPHYILYVPDETQTSDWQGGYTPWYVYRSAEAYLIMAEAYYWKGDNANCAAMLNEVRRRAGAEDLTADEAGISAILAERARELFYSEPRHVELVRISYMYARSGKTCEWNGRQYSMENFSGPEGTGTTNPCTDEGYNFYYDWVVAHNDFYYKGNGTNTQYSETGYVQYAKGIFRIAVHNALWPIPESAIVDNKGDLNQNDGYVKVASHPYNIEPLQIEIDKHGYE